jgi:hypothetical protein
MSSDIATRLGAVRERIAGACRRAGRPADAVTLVAVSKGHPAEAVIEAAEAGQRVFAENYAQELLDKAAATADRGLAWHFVGGLQRNKIKKMVGLAALLQSVDDLEAAAEIDRRSAALGRVQDVLVQVNVDAEGQKSGILPAHLPALLDAMACLPHVRCSGLMAIPRATDDPAGTRASFRALAALARTHDLPELSMGMSSDFEVAIEEGATLVRIGTALFGPRRARRLAPGGGSAASVA